LLVLAFTPTRQYNFEHHHCTMKIEPRVIAAWVYIFLIAIWAAPAHVYSQTPPKAVVLAWDGAVPTFVHEMLRQGKLPNLAKLIEGGAFADEVLPVFPSSTAPGFASLATGAPPRITGISGNRVPRAPRSQFTILDSSVGFNPALLRAETLSAAAERAGRKIVVTHVPFGGESSEHGVHFQGYAGIAGREGVVNGRTSDPQPPASWENLPASAAPPLEVTFTISASTFFALLIDDPSDPQDGYDTFLVANSRDGSSIKTILKSAPAGSGGELFWSRPIEVKTNDGRNATTYLRLFDLKRDGSDFFLLFTRPAREVVSRPDLLQETSPTVRAFIGNGANQLYSQGALGPTLAAGGDGTAEARYLESVVFAQHQLMETNRWALEHLPWDLFVAYTPYPDEAEHMWRGFLEYSLPGFRRELASRLRPFLERVYETADELVGLILEKRPENTIVALISDHGMEGTNRLIAINKVLQQGRFLAMDDRGRLDLARTKALYPAVNNGYLLINSTDRKAGIVAPEEREEVARRLRDLLFEIKDGDRHVVTGIYDAQTDGDAMGIGGESGGDLYVDLLPGYEWDAKLGAVDVISKREPHGMHGFNPQRVSMRTIMVFNGPGVQTKRKLSDVRIIDFAPTLAKLLDLPGLPDATGRVLDEALTVSP
jgi:predicted AlkP superfamily phosphohydrolase/phosphomutase